MLYPSCVVVISGQLPVFSGPECRVIQRSSSLMACLSSVDHSHLLHPFALAASQNLPLHFDQLLVEFPTPPPHPSNPPAQVFYLGKPLKSEGKIGSLNCSELNILFSKFKILCLTAWERSHSKHGYTTNRITLRSCVQHMQKHKWICV